MNSTPQKPQSSPTKITIIGCGPAGSLLATLLAQKKYQVDVFEQRVDMRIENISAGRSINLALANRGIVPLQVAGVMKKIEARLTTMEGRMLHDENGNQTLQKYGQKAHEVIYSVSRGDLNKILMDAAEATGQVNITFNSNITQVDFDNNQIHYNVGKESRIHEYDILIGADGAGSIVRSWIEKYYENDNKAKFSVIPLDHGYKELTFPAVNNQFVLEPHALHIWPRGEFMLIALPNDDGSFTVTLFLPEKGEHSFDSLQTQKHVADFFKQYFPDTLELLPNLAQMFFQNPTGHLATVRCNRWHVGKNVLLIGDAAHAVVPFHGQGMNCAFEDCLELLNQLDLHQDDWQQVIPQYCFLRKPSTDAIADMALENYIEMRASVKDKKFALKKELSWLLESKFPQYFIPRYSMVMFHHLPYAEAFRRGKIQQQILQQLTTDINHISSIDMKLAARLILQRLDVLPSH